MKICKFIDTFLTKIISEIWFVIKYLILATAGIVIVELLWESGWAAKLLLIVTALYLIGTSGVETYFELKNNELDKELHDVISTHNKIQEELDKLVSRKKEQDSFLLFRKYLNLTSKEMKDNGKR